MGVLESVRKAGDSSSECGVWSWGFNGDAVVMLTVPKDAEEVLGLGAWKPLVAWEGTALTEWVLGSKGSDSKWMEQVQGQ